MDDSPPGSSVHGICQARELEWGAIAFSNNHLYRVPKYFHHPKETPLPGAVTPHLLPPWPLETTNLLFVPKDLLTILYILE